MYENKDFYLDEDLCFSLEMPPDRPLKILQLTDLHLGFGPLSKAADAQALADVTTLVKAAKPDLIVLTGDSIFPFLPKSGTLNNLKQAKKLTSFFDSFRIPYALVFGNHDIEIGAKGSREQVGEIFAQGEYGIFRGGPRDVFGVGNYIIKLKNCGRLVSALCFLDSNMYGDGWFFSGFDCIHSDQTAWCMKNLSRLKAENPAVTGLAFFHMPLADYKTAYEKMKLGDSNVSYNFGAIGEPNDYFGISKNPCDFFEKAVENGVIRGMFCGHDHYNTLSLNYRGITLTYGMSIDYLGYTGIKKRYTQRGGTTIEVSRDGSFSAGLLPIKTVVSGFVRGQK